jgi:hypothetical protein
VEERMTAHGRRRRRTEYGRIQEDQRYKMQATVRDSWSIGS